MVIQNSLQPAHFTQRAHTALNSMTLFTKRVTNKSNRLQDKTKYHASIVIQFTVSVLLRTQRSISRQKNANLIGESISNTHILTIGARFYDYTGVGSRSRGWARLILALKCVNTTILCCAREMCVLLHLTANYVSAARSCN